MIPFRQARCVLAGCLAAICLSVPVCGQAAPAPQNQANPSQAESVTPTLRVTTRTVEVSAVVRNKSGEPQGTLTKDDFILKEDGKEEPIRYFTVASDLPLTLALLVDVSGSQRTFIGDEWRASDIFFQTMLTRPQDRAALVQIDARILQLMGLTNSASSLHLALTQLGANNAASGRTLLDDAVYATSRSLAKEQGRKAIILLTDGGDNGSHVTLDQAIEQAQRANVPVYAVLYSAWAGFSSLNSGLGGLKGGDPGQALLKKLAESTGGHVYTVVPGMTLKKIYEAIENDLRTQYQIGYIPPPDLQPNSFHKLDLRTKDKKLVVQARTGFYVQP